MDASNFYSLTQTSIAALVTWFAVLLPLVLVASYARKKWAADIHSRVGPDQNPSHGLFSGVYSIIKLLNKKGVSSEGSLARAALITMFFCLLVVATSIPLYEGAGLSEIKAAPLFFVFILFVFSVLTLFYAAKKTEYENLFSTVHWVTNAALVSVTLTVLLGYVYISCGGLQWGNVIQSQASGMLGWNLFRAFPAGVFATVSWLLCWRVLFSAQSYKRGLVNRPRAGHSLLFYGFVKQLFEWIYIIVTVTLFFGGWSSFLDSMGPVAQVFVLMFKSFTVYVVGHTVSENMRALSSQQQTSVLVRVALPLALLSVIISVLFYVLGRGVL